MTPEEKEKILARITNMPEGVDMLLASPAKFEAAAIVASDFADLYPLSLENAFRIISACGTIVEDGIPIRELINHIKNFAPGCFQK